MGHKYVGLDVHQSSTVVAVQDEKGKSVMESILRTEAEAVRDFLKGLRGTIHVTFEEGTQAAWLYEIVKPVVAEAIVCNPRRNKLLAVKSSSVREIAPPGKVITKEPVSAAKSKLPRKVNT